MNKIKLNGEFTKEELLEKMKEFDKKPLFKIKGFDNDLYMLRKDGEYEYVSCSEVRGKRLLQETRCLFEDILVIAKFKLPTFKEIMNGDKELFGIYIGTSICDGDGEDLMFKTLGYYSEFLNKWWSEEANDYIEKYVLPNKVFKEWFEDKFNYYRK